MSSAQMNYYSTALSRITSFRILIPNDLPEEWAKDNPYFKGTMKTLVLLHGYSGYETDWMYNSRILDLSNKYNLAVILPSGENSFYLDAKGTGRKYATYVGKELPEFCQRTFGLSGNKEDMLIGGYSMGGFGALHTSLQFPDTFSGVFALSSALIIHDVEKMEPGFQDILADYEYYRSVFGDPSEVAQSENNPEKQILRILEMGKQLPKMFMACGTEDFLIQKNRDFQKFLDEHHVEREYRESSGTHDFRFWNAYLEPAVSWLLA